MADHFDYLTATEEEVLEKASELRDRTLGTLPGAAFTAATGAVGRAEVGHAIEGHFGIPPNTSPLPDFPAAGIELKSLPLRRTGRGLGIKERTVISQINYIKLMDQTWASASVRSKLRILFVFFEHLDEKPKGLFPIKGVHLWTPDARTTELLRADWQRVFTKVRHAQAHELSESDGAIMGPCTKGAKGAFQRQPFSDRPAKPRAWALKPSFTKSIFHALSAHRTAAESLVEELHLRATDFEKRLIERFAPFVGRKVNDIADELSVPRSTSKSYAASVARRIFGARSVKARILEFDEMGLTLRTPRVRNDLLPYEHLSFAAFDYHDLLDETWQDSALLAQVEYMLFVPVIGRTRETPQGDCTFRWPTFWRPSAEQLELIRQEWEIYRLEIRQQKAATLTPASGTQAIHIRPHGRDAADTTSAPGVSGVVKKSFWLNKAYVQGILKEE